MSVWHYTVPLAVSYQGTVALPLAPCVCVCCEGGALTTLSTGFTEVVPGIQYELAVTVDPCVHCQWWHWHPVPGRVARQQNTSFLNNYDTLALALAWAALQRALHTRARCPYPFQIGRAQV